MATLPANMRKRASKLVNSERLKVKICEFVQSCTRGNHVHCWKKAMTAAHLALFRFAELKAESNLLCLLYCVLFDNFSMFSCQYWGTAQASCIHTTWAWAQCAAPREVCLEAGELVAQMNIMCSHHNSQLSFPSFLGMLSGAAMINCYLWRVRIFVMMNPCCWWCRWWPMWSYNSDVPG